MRQIYLVRHGQASFDADDYDQLSSLGYQQSEHLGQYFSERDIAFDHVFTGTLKRHQQTMESILGENKMPEHHVLSGLNEYDFNTLYKTYMANHHKKKPSKQDNEESDRRLFYIRLKEAMGLWSEGLLQGEISETWAEFNVRVAKSLQYIHEKSTGHCLVVSSGGPISTAIGHILNLAPAKIIDLNLQIKNTSFSHLYLGKETMNLSNFNSIPHLDHPSRMHKVTYS